MLGAQKILKICCTAITAWDASLPFSVPRHDHTTMNCIYWDPVGFRDKKNSVIPPCAVVDAADSHVEYACDFLETLTRIPPDRDFLLLRSFVFVPSHLLWFSLVAPLVLFISFFPPVRVLVRCVL